ncbi:MAG: amidohydrolase family protein [Alphaproteobacteria bacterium]|nr:amidohydrolase family protein [Alphaproteobacteria bacterium]
MTRKLFTNALIFDGVNSNLLADHFVAIENDIIQSVSSQRPDGRFDQVIDLKGAVMLPGFIDAHFHASAVEIDLAKLETYPTTYVAQRSRHLMEQALRRGFTTVRDVGGADYGLWRAIEEGFVSGPRLFYCGRAFSQAGGHGDSRAPHMEWQPCGCCAHGGISEVVDGVDAIRKSAREALRQGAHHLKIFVSGGIASPSDPIWMLQFSEAEIAAVVDEAVRRRAYVAAHAYTAETITRAVRLGVRSIEHANLIDKAAAADVSRHGAFVVPTLATYNSLYTHGREMGAPDHLLEKLEVVRGRGLEAIELCRAAGVKLGFGTDLLGPLHAHQRDEFRLRAEVETPAQILTSATSVNAELINMSGKLGCIAPGAYADFVIVDGNPLEDLSLLYRPVPAITQIWKGGTPVH